MKPATRERTQQTLSAWASSAELQGLPPPQRTEVVRPGLAAIWFHQHRDREVWIKQYLTAGTARMVVITDTSVFVRISEGVRIRLYVEGAP